MKKKNKKIKDLLSNQKGIALLTVLIFIFLMVTFVVALLAMTGNDIKISAIQRDSTEAFYQAESGIEQALYNLNVSDAYDIIYWRPGPAGQNPPEPYKKSPFNSSEYYEVTITDIGELPELPTDKISIISTGILTPVGVEHSRKRSIEVIAEIGWNTDVTYKYALLSDNLILINGSGPDPAKISGDVHSNDAIEVHSNNFDDFYTGIATSSGQTNDLDETDDGEFTGIDPVDLPPIDYVELLLRAQTPGGGNYISGNKILENDESWVVGSESGGLDNAGIQYIDGDLIVHNGSFVDIHNGAVVVTGKIEFKNGSELEITKDEYYIDYNDPITALALVGQGDIDLKAKTSFIGGVIQSYCPIDTPPFYASGTVELYNRCVVNGSIIAETIFLHNRTEVYYDETNLQKYVTTGDPFYKKISWREL